MAGVAVDEGKGALRVREGKAFDRAAQIIGAEMGKYTNFGVIEDGHGNFRVFYGGDLDEIINGVAIGIAHLCDMVGDAEVADDIASAVRAILESRKGGAVS